MKIRKLHERARRWAKRFVGRYVQLPVSIGREGYVAGYLAAMRDVRKRELAANQPPCDGCAAPELCGILGCAKTK